MNASGNADYTKNVLVNKSVNLVGTGEEVTTIQAFDPGDYVFYVTSDGVNISGFKVTGATSGSHPVFSAGIFFSSAII